MISIKFFVELSVDTLGVGEAIGLTDNFEEEHQGPLAWKWVLEPVSKYMVINKHFKYLEGNQDYRTSQTNQMLVCTCKEFSSDLSFVWCLIPDSFAPTVKPAVIPK